MLAKTLRRFGEALHLEPIALALDNQQPPLTAWRDKAFRPDVSLARRILPTSTMEGFFIAKIRKVASTGEDRRKGG